VQARDVTQAELRRIDAGRVALLVRDPDEVALGVERPGVVEALEGLRVAGVLTADARAAVRARVVKRTHHAVTTAQEDQRAPGDLAPDEVARRVDLGVVAAVQPAAVEDALALERPHVVAGHRLALDAEHSALAIVDDGVLQI